MNCTEFDQHWHRRLDVGAGTDPAHLRTHLAECPRCQAWQQAWETLERAIDHSSGPLPANNAARPHHALADRVVAELQVGSSQAVRRRLSDNSTARLQKTGAVSHRRPTHRGPVRQYVLAAVCLTTVCLVWGSRWLPRPGSGNPQRVTLTGTEEVAGLPAQKDPLEVVTRATQLSARFDLPSERRIVSGPPLETGNGGEADRVTSRPPIVKPLVGMVHNLTSLVLPGWPSVFNDSVGIPHYLDGETSEATIPGTTSPSVQNALVLVQPTGVSWPEPVEELLAVASESVQTMWDLANQW